MRSTRSARRSCGTSRAASSSSATPAGCACSSLSSFLSPSSSSSRSHCRSWSRAVAARCQDRPLYFELREAPYSVWRGHVGQRQQPQQQRQQQPVQQRPSHSRLCDRVAHTAGSRHYPAIEQTVAPGVADQYERIFLAYLRGARGGEIQRDSRVALPAREPGARRWRSAARERTAGDTARSPSLGNAAGDAAHDGIERKWR
jgi:hypothetical protein